MGSIGIGSRDVQKVFVGNSNDCTVYLGQSKIHDGNQPSVVIPTVLDMNLTDTLTVPLRLVAVSTDSSSVPSQQDAGTLYVDWGDGTSEQFPPTSTSDYNISDHTYASAGTYRIQIWMDSNDYAFGCRTALFGNIFGYINTGKAVTGVSTALASVQIGSNVRLSSMVPSYEAAFMFANCTSLTSVVIPGTCNKVGGAFYKCSSLTSVVIEDGVEEFEGESYGTFYGTQITSIHLPKSVRSVGDIQYGCLGLLSYTVDSSNPYLMAEDGVLYNKTKTEMVAYPPAKNTATASIPGTVTKITSGCFQSQQYITSITVPQRVSHLEGYVFREAAVLANVEVQSQVLDVHAFTTTPQLKVWLRNSVTVATVDQTHSPFTGAPSSTQVYVEAQSQPQGFDTYWNCYNASDTTKVLPVTYGQTTSPF